MTGKRKIKRIFFTRERKLRRRDERKEEGMQMGKMRWKNLLLSMLLVLLVVGMLLYVKEKAGDTGRTEATLVKTSGP